MATQKRRDFDTDSGRDLDSPVIVLTAIYALFLIAVIVLNLGWL